MLSIIVPTYNERDNIALLVRRLEAALEGEHEIIVVDDSSPDGTAALVRELSGKFPALRLVSRSSKAGLTGAIVAGAAAAKGEMLLVMDADLSHPPEKAAELWHALGDADIAVGSRMAAGGGVESWPLHRRLISKSAEMMARLTLGISCSDPLSGFFAVRRDVFLRTRFRTKGYKLLLNILADNRKARLAEVPYVFRDRHAGKTKLGAGEIFRFIADLFRIRFG
jgi:dolichol-phosphate mannosyltransferase